VNGMKSAQSVSSKPDISAVQAAIADVCDPEIPVLTLFDLGVIRAIEFAHDDAVEITITPTYSGCPAMNVMAIDLQTALLKAGFDNARIKTSLSSAWTTDWMSNEGRKKLLDYGIAPPAAKASRRALFGDNDALACPLCASTRTVKMSEFGSTACKSLWRCESCLEPFDAFKCI
jgi:ring-1,2-phenylacetyl-CoA epoxidase subunit PaaD